MRKKRKILIIFNQLGIGGASKILAHLANYLNENGYKIVVIALSKNKQTVPLNKDINIYKLGYEGEYIKTYSIFSKFIKKIKLIFEIRSIIKKENPSLIIAFMCNIVLISYLAKVLMDVKLIGSERSNPKRYSKRSKYIYGLTYSKCDAVVFQTSLAADTFNNSKMPKRIIPNSNTLEAVYGLDHNDKIIFSCGRLSKEKGFDVLIESFAIVLEKFPDYKLHIYGNGEMRTQLLNKIEDYGLMSKVFLFNGRTDVFEEESNSSLFILPSFEEGFPNVLLEAMSFGFPIVATDCEIGAPRLLLEGQNEILVRPRNKTDLARGIIYAINNKEIMSKYVSQNYKTLNDYKSEVVDEKWLKLVAEVISC